MGALALCAMLALKLSMVSPAMAIPAAQAATPPATVYAIAAMHHGGGAAATAEAARCHQPPPDSNRPAEDCHVSCAAACAALPALAIEVAPGAELRGIAADAALVDQLSGHPPEIEVPPPR